MEWTRESENTYIANLSNVLILRCCYYPAYGWRGSIEGAYNFPSHKSYGQVEDAMMITEAYASGLLKSAMSKLDE